MTTIRVLLSRTLDLMLRRRRHRRLSEEIEAHLDLLTRDYIARGLDPSAARQAARRAFGGVDQMKAAYRDQQGLPFLDAFGQDVRFAGRLLRRDRGFAVTAVLVLGLGIGVNNMLFAILNGHTLRGLPIANAARIVAITTADDRAPDRGVSYLDLADWRNAAHSLAELAAFSNAPMVVSEKHRAPDRFDGAFVSGNAFATIGVQPILGRDFRPEEDRPGAAAAVMLGAGAWRSRYAGDRGILGRSITVNGTPATIVGVMSDRSGFPSTAQIWLPLSQAPGLAARPRDARSLRVIGRLRDGRSLPEARAEMEAIAQGLAQQHPETNANTRARVVPIDEQYFGSVNNPAWLAFMATGFIIVVISCANAANLLLGQSFHRAREIAIRTSLGASRRRVVRQLLIEAGVLAALSGTLGLSLAMIGVRLFRSAIPADALPYWIDYSPDVRVVAALIGVSAATIFLFALLPAIHVSRTDVNAVLKDGGRTGTGRRGRMWTTGFLAAEFALAVVFLAQFSAQLRNAGPRVTSDAVIDTTDVLTAAITIPPAKYASPDDRDRFYRGLRERLHAQPIVFSMSVASGLPLSGAEERRLDIGGRPAPDAKAQPTVRTVAIAPGYFRTLGLTLGRGRDFTDADGGPGDEHAIVNERFVEQVLGTADPIGQRIAITPLQSPAGAPSWLTIVGVAPSIRQRPSAGADAVVYTPFRSDSPATGFLVVRGRVESGQLASLLRDEVSKLDSSLPVYRLRTMAQVMRDAQWNGRLSSRLFLMLTFIAVVLATIGLYAVTAHGVAQRAQEIGLRMALGAQPRQVVRLVARRVAMQLAIGFMAGIVCTKLWDWNFGSGSAGVTASDPQSLLVVAFILVVLAMAASVVPARRALRVDPIVAIRQE
jgi:putative ABC transport system permease protein